jgi:predicted Zn-dependent protease
MGMDHRILEALERHPSINDWTVRRTHAVGSQVYLAAGTLESVRRVGREAYAVDVYCDHEVDGEAMRGSVTIPVGRDELAGFDRVLDEAVLMARLIHNKPWPLPEAVAHPGVALADPALDTADDAVAAARDAVDLIHAQMQQAPDVRLSAAELFLSVVGEEVANSRGLHAEGRSTSVLLELVLLARGDEDEAELFRHAEARRLEDLRLADVVSEGTRLVRDANHARIPTSRVGPVVLSDMALNQLLSPGVTGLTGAILTQAGAGAAYSGLSLLELGEPVFLGREPTGDPLTVRSNARRPYGVLAYEFDEDGLPAQDLLVIEDGILRARPATQRYAHYLGLPATGRPGVPEIAPGPTPFADLLAADGPVVHVLAFSSPNVEAVTGNFGMEIRVGYEVGPDGVVPLKGGSVTGNLFEALAAARFSAETGQDAGYAGPQAIRFEALQVTGTDG